MRFTLPVLAAAAALLIAGGCPTTGPEEPLDPEKMTPQASAPEAVEVGESVSLTAQLADDVDPSSVTYRWFQIYGRAVELENAETASASFVAPSLPAAQTLRFRIDVTASDGAIYSDTAAVTVAADPDYETEDVWYDEDDPYPQVRLVTSRGTITLELDRENAPKTVNNFLRYVDDGFYENTIFHRVIEDFVVQGGGYDEDLEEKETRPPILNESDNGLTNDRGTVAMARLDELDTATAQFFINVKDNDHLNATEGTNDGYAVFGRVIDGLDVVDEIAAVETETRDGMSDVPVTNVVLSRVQRLSSDSDSDSDSDAGDDGDDAPILDKG
jgi:cyclophilin family peptidyl-prolyl cis-trans isomerase